jgi:hypothetical protein
MDDILILILDIPEYHRQAPFQIFLGSTFSAFKTRATATNTGQIKMPFVGEESL